MVQQRQADTQVNKGAEEPNIDDLNQVEKLVLAAQACAGEAEPMRTLDGHELEDYLTPDGS